MDIKITTYIVVTLSSGILLSFAQTDSAEDNKLKEVAFVAQSSRKLLGDTKAAWIAEMRAKLPIASRRTGPFGMVQDLRAKIVEKKKSKPPPRAFINAIKAIKINAVIASKRKFIIGARQFYAGDAFPVIRGQRQFNVEIVAVKSDHIVFKDVDTGEFVKKNLNVLPPGMVRSSSLNAVPGIVPVGKKDKSPLHLDSPTLPTSTSR
ncbi:MAG: hypothetical protein AB8F34_06610 [Akkermansiaceae bacterium]